MISKKRREEIFQELNHHVKVPHEAFEKLSLYHDLLAGWQKKINLISPNTLEDAWHRHFLDSLQLINFIPDSASIICDVGSGAGFPGMALAIMGTGELHLIERDIRKIAFLREVARVTSTKVSIHHGNIENEPSFHPKIITARACAPLSMLLDLITAQVSHGTICLFPKGKNWSMEMESAKKHRTFEYAVIPSVADSEGVILRLTHIKKREL